MIRLTALLLVAVGLAPIAPAPPDTLEGRRSNAVGLPVLRDLPSGGLAAATTRGGFGGVFRDSPDNLVAEGERWWRQSPDAGNPVACATCHHDPAATRSWAASFPKVKPFPPPHTRVMTLLQASAEAVARHYRLADPRPAATAISAYLAALGSDVRISPGISAGQPVFPERMRRLAASVRRGERLYVGRCRACHHESDVAGSVRGFPRVRAGVAESIESFLEAHHPNAKPLAWDGQAMADLIAYLVSRLAHREESP